MAKSRVLIIGATGNLGFHLANASLCCGHPTFALVRESAFSQTEKSQKIEALSSAGVKLLRGSLQDFESLINAVKQVDVVISAVPAKHVLDQNLLIRAIKQAGCIKRFIPAEFGVDPDKIQISNLGYDFYSRKAEIRRIIETESIPYTYISCNFFTSYLLPSLVQPGLRTPPRDKVRIFGDGNTKAVFVKETDVAIFTINSVDDPRTLNKVLHLRPLGNVYTMNELVEIWETKIGKKLEKVYISEEQLLENIRDTPYPNNMEMIFIYSAFIKGDQTYFDIESSDGVNGTDLYPNVKYTTVRYLFVTIASRYSECLAVREGLLQAISDCVEYIEVECDNSSLISFLNDGSIHPPSDVSPIVQDIKYLANCFAVCSFSFIPREINSVADSLAVQALSMSCMTVWPSCTPWLYDSFVSSVIPSRDFE